MRRRRRAGWGLLALGVLGAAGTAMGAVVRRGPTLETVPLPPLLYGHTLPAIASRAYAIGGAIPQPPLFAPAASDPLSATVYFLDVPGALAGQDSPWAVDAAATVAVLGPQAGPGGAGTKPPPLVHHCAVPVGPRILVLFGQTVAPDGARIPSPYPPLWFDPADGSWTPLRQEGADWITPAPRYYHSCAFHGKTARVFVFGGVKKEADGPEEETGELWTLDVNDGWWEEVDLRRIGGESLERRRVGSTMHIVNGASNYLFICFGSPGVNVRPLDPSCNILDIAGAFPSNITLLPANVLAGTPPRPRMYSSFSTKIPYENSVMFGYGGYDGAEYMEDLFAIDASGLPANASWIPVVPTPQYPNPKRYRPGPRSDYGRLIPLPLPVQTPGMPQPQLLWGGSTGPAKNLSRALPPLLPNTSYALSTIFSLDPGTWGWEASYPSPVSPGDQVSLWDQPGWKWGVAAACLGAALVLFAIMLWRCIARGGAKDPDRMLIPIIGRIWRPDVGYDEEDELRRKGSKREMESIKNPKVLGTGEVLATEPWKSTPSNQVSPVDDEVGSPMRRSVAGFAATLGRTMSMVTGSRAPQSPASPPADTNEEFLDSLGPHASAAFERRSLVTVGSKRDNLAAAAAAGLLGSQAPPDRRSRTASKRHSVGGLPTAADDSESDYEASPDSADSAPAAPVPLVPVHYASSLPEGMTLYDLFSTPQPPPSEPALIDPAAAGKPPPARSAPRMIENSLPSWEMAAPAPRKAPPGTRILTYDLFAGVGSSGSPVAVSATSNPSNPSRPLRRTGTSSSQPVRGSGTGQKRADSGAESEGEAERKLVVSNPDEHPESGGREPQA